MTKRQLILLTLLLAVSCGPSGSHSSSVALPTVNLDTLRCLASQETLHYPGRVRASEEVNLGFKVSGRIARVLVKEGDYVKKGQLIAELDPSDYQVQLQATEAEHARITAESDRIVKLYQDNAVPANEYDKAIFGKKQIDAKLKNHQDQLSYTRLCAPISGYVQSKLMSSGEMASAGLPVISLIGGPMEVEINLSARDRMQEASFREMSASFDLLPGRSIPLTPVSISHKANANQLYLMRLALRSQDAPGLSPGMNAMVSIRLSGETASSGLTLPTGGVLHTAEGDYVFVYDSENGTVHKKSVKLDRLLPGGRCVVMSDELREGSPVVSSGTHYVQDGQAVRPLAPISETNIGGLL